MGPQHTSPIRQTGGAGDQTRGPLCARQVVNPLHFVDSGGLDMCILIWAFSVLVKNQDVSAFPSKNVCQAQGMGVP